MVWYVKTCRDSHKIKMHCAHFSFQAEFGISPKRILRLHLKSMMLSIATINIHIFKGFLDSTTYFFALVLAAIFDHLIPKAFLNQARKWSFHEWRQIIESNNHIDSRWDFEGEWRACRYGWIGTRRNQSGNWKVELEELWMMTYPEFILNCLSQSHNNRNSGCWDMFHIQSGPSWTKIQIQTIWHFESI